MGSYRNCSLKMFPIKSYPAPLNHVIFKIIRSMHPRVSWPRKILCTLLCTQYQGINHSIVSTWRSTYTRYSDHPPKNHFVDYKIVTMHIELWHNLFIIYRKNNIKDSPVPQKIITTTYFWRNHTPPREAATCDQRKKSRILSYHFM